ncbi:MAG: chemotaxis protein CheW, partial [Campylobacterales bacterium]
IINLRGLVIPIISLPERLGYPEKIDMNSKILVSRYRDRKVGFLVDNVSEILFVSPSQMTRNDAPDALFTDIINLEEQKRMILRLSIDKIFAQTPIESVGFAGG